MVSLRTFYGLPTWRDGVIAVELHVRPLILILPTLLLAAATFLLMRSHLSDPVPGTLPPDVAVHAAKRDLRDAQVKLHYLEGATHHVNPRGALSN